MTVRPFGTSPLVNPEVRQLGSSPAGTSPTASAYECAVIDEAARAGDRGAGGGATGRQLHDEAAGPALVEAGLPPFAADQLLAVFAALRQGAQATTTDTVSALTGRGSRSFPEVARGYASAFRSGGVNIGA